MKLTCKHLIRPKCGHSYEELYVTLCYVSHTGSFRIMSATHVMNFFLNMLIYLMLAHYLFEGFQSFTKGMVYLCIFHDLNMMPSSHISFALDQCIQRPTKKTTILQIV